MNLTRNKAAYHRSHRKNKLLKSSHPLQFYGSAKLRLFVSFLFRTRYWTRLVFERLGLGLGKCLDSRVRVESSGLAMP